MKIIKFTYNPSFYFDSRVKNYLCILNSDHIENWMDYHKSY